MKFAGVVLLLVGGWILLTMGFALQPENQTLAAYAQRIEVIAPYTALVVGAIGLCVLGAWLYDKGETK